MLTLLLPELTLLMSFDEVVDLGPLGGEFFFGFLSISFSSMFSCFIFPTASFFLSKRPISIDWAEGWRCLNKLAR